MMCKLDWRFSFLWTVLVVAVYGLFFSFIFDDVSIVFYFNLSDEIQVPMQLKS